MSSKVGGVTISAGEAAAGAVQATVIYEEWEEGMYSHFVNWPSKITARVVFTKDGQVIDEIRIKTQENATLSTAAPQGRLHTCGKRVGQYAGEYVINVTQ